MRRIGLALFCLIQPSVALAETVKLAPLAPTSTDEVLVLCASYYLVNNETHSVVGNTINVQFVEASFDWDPNPPYGPGVAMIGPLAAGAYTVNVQVTGGFDPTVRTYTLPLSVAAAADPVSLPSLSEWAAATLASLIVIAAGLSFSLRSRD